MSSNDSRARLEVQDSRQEKGQFFKLLKSYLKMMNGSSNANDRTVEVCNNAVREQNPDAETIPAQSTLTENMA